jgi:hypothetical protein
MVTIERTSGQGVKIGPYTVQVLAVQRDRVVVALLDPRTDCLSCGRSLVEHRCPVCQAEAFPWPDCSPPCVK